MAFNDTYELEMGVSKMTESGQRIYQTLSSVRDLFEDIARLLEDCDRLMGDHGWAAPDSTGIRGASASIGNPRSWLPNAASRIYDAGEPETLLKVIAVVFEDQWGTGQFEEPIVVGSTYSGSISVPLHLKSWDHTWWWIKYAAERKDGSKTVLDASSSDDAEYEKEIGRFATIEMLGHPLDTFSNIEDIETKIVRPLTES